MDPVERKLKVFVADDDEDDFDIVKSAFDEVGCAQEIRCFSTSTALFDTLLKPDQGDLPDLIILDYQLPGHTGSEAVTRIRSDLRFQAIALVVYTSAIAPNRAEELQQNGVDLCMQKGSTLFEITQHVRAFCLLAEQRRNKAASLH